MSMKDDNTSNLDHSERIVDDDDENEGDDCQYIFPQRLMSILGDERNHDAICWLPHGRAFIIRNRALFAERVMPKFFSRKSKYSSFTRKLNRWNFIRVSSGPELGAYYHEFFLRDKPQLAQQMFCKNARTKIAMASPDPIPTAAPASNKFEQDTIQQQQTQKDQPGLDAVQLLMATQQVDPAMQMLLEQQMYLGRQHMNAQLQIQQDPRSILRAPGSMATLALEMEIQKQQQQRLIQLQQLIALKRLNGQQKRKNNFRASAA